MKITTAHIYLLFVAYMLGCLSGHLFTEQQLTAVTIVTTAIVILIFLFEGLIKK